MPSSNKKTLLIIDDDRFFCDSISSYLSDNEYQILAAHTVAQGEVLCLNQQIDVILLDQKLPDGNGIDLCKTILKTNDQVKIIFITAYPNFDNAVKALRNGAFDYLSKPLEVEEVAMTVTQAFRTLELETVEQIQNYKEKQEFDKNVLIGIDCGLREAYNHIKLAAINDVPVLITGETGTGKNVAAKAIHYHKGLRSGTFMAINCAALPENLIEAELFGYEKGAFTGASSTRKGIFELAHGGTLFLDEIGDLPLHLQSKLLGVLDDHRVKRLGGQSFKTVSVRIIAATNVNLQEAVKKQRFRQDLYYRLSVLPIHLPPLRDRVDDIQPLCQYFINCSAFHQKVILPPDEIPKLQDYTWPGNVREMKNIIERALIFQRNGKIYPSELLLNQQQTKNPQPTATEPLLTLEEVEKSHIETTLDLLQHNHTQTAKSLGISRSTLLRKLKKYSITTTVSE